MAYLVMAALCLLGGAAVLVSQWLHPENTSLTIRGISLGWVLLVFAAYDLLRWWWSPRAAPRQTESVADAWTERRRAREQAEKRRQIVPDATFDFERQPPADGPPQ